MGSKPQNLQLKFKFLSQIQLLWDVVCEFPLVLDNLSVLRNSLRFFFGDFSVFVLNMSILVSFPPLFGIYSPIIFLNIFTI